MKTIQQWTDTTPSAALPGNRGNDPRHPGTTVPSWWPPVSQAEVQASIRATLRTAILKSLSKQSHGITPNNLALSTIVWEFEWDVILDELVNMQNDKLVILHMDSSADQRHSQGFGGVTLVCLRPKGMD